MPNKLLVLTRDQDEFETNLRALELPDLELYVPRSEQEIEAVLPHANILLANPLRASKYINQATNVRWMQSTFAGVDANFAMRMVLV